jgi:hypothetical protein
MDAKMAMMARGDVLYIVKERQLLLMERFHLKRTHAP